MNSTYDMIRTFQNESFEKYGSYSHAAGWLGAMLESAIIRLPKKQQKYYNDRLQEVIDEVEQTPQLAAPLTLFRKSV